MSNETLKVLSWIFFSLSAIGMIIGMIIFIKFRMIEVIQDLNGTLTEKKIKQMRERAAKENFKNFGQDVFEKGLGEKDSTEQYNSNENFQEERKNEGTTLLQTNRPINQNFVMRKNIVYINTSEII